MTAQINSPLIFGTLPDPKLHLKRVIGDEQRKGKRKHPPKRDLKMVAEAVVRNGQFHIIYTFNNKLGEGVFFIVGEKQTAVTPKKFQFMREIMFQ